MDSQIKGCITLDNP